jgi:hypothetical protein
MPHLNPNLNPHAYVSVFRFLFSPIFGVVIQSSDGQTRDCTCCENTWHDTSYSGFILGWLCLRLEGIFQVSFSPNPWKCVFFSCFCLEALCTQKFITEADHGATRLDNDGSFVLCYLCCSCCCCCCCRSIYGKTNPHRLFTTTRPH